MSLTDLNRSMSATSKDIGWPKRSVRLASLAPSSLSVRRLDRPVSESLAASRSSVALSCCSRRFCSVSCWLIWAISVSRHLRSWMLNVTPIKRLPGVSLWSSMMRP